MHGSVIYYLVKKEWPDKRTVQVLAPPLARKARYIPQSPRTSYQKETAQQKVPPKPSSALKSVPVSQDTTDGNLPLEMAKATQACWNSFVAKHHVFRFGDPVPKKTVEFSEHQKQLVTDSENSSKKANSYRKNMSIRS